MVGSLGPSQNQPLDKQIEEALQKTACLVIVLTPGFLESPWCPKELDAFRQYMEIRVARIPESL